MDRVRDAVRRATTQAEVLRRMSSFLDDLRACHVDSVLPQRLRAIAARDADEVRAWAQRLGQDDKKDTCSLSAGGHYWMEELQDAYAAAARRLNQIRAAQERLASSPVA